MKSFNKEIKWILNEKHSGKLSALAEKDVERLRKGEPLDYIIGFKEFLGCKIDLSKRPLIPRTETEYWVKIAIGKLHGSLPVRSLKQNLRILDIFAGSGCIGISIMRQVNNLQITFVEKNKEFLEQIKINCKLNNIGKRRYKIISSDVFSNLNGKFDYIFANPPYIPISRKNKIQKSVLNYEPKEALFGGKNGMFYIRKFLASAKNFLKPNGKIFMEFDSMPSTQLGPNQKKQIKKLIEKHDYEKFEFHKDQYGKWRWVVIKTNQKAL